MGQLAQAQGTATPARHRGRLALGPAAGGRERGPAGPARRHRHRRAGQLPAQRPARPARYTLRVGALGYRAQAVPVTLAAGETRAWPCTWPPRPLSLAEVTVSQPRDPNQSLAAISHIDQLLRPVNSAQDLLRLVPGLFIAQHAGGGKAEQIFLRGFDCDHGTDFAVSVDGLPVNMVSHAHGQGYADFHFVIPETVDQLKVYKGPVHGPVWRLCHGRRGRVQHQNPPGAQPGEAGGGPVRLPAGRW